MKPKLLAARRHRLRPCVSKRRLMHPTHLRARLRFVPSRRRRSVEQRARRRHDHRAVRTLDARHLLCDLLHCRRRSLRRAVDRLEGRSTPSGRSALCGPADSPGELFEHLKGIQSDLKNCLRPYDETEVSLRVAELR